MNEARVSKLSWKLKCGDEALWCQILKKKIQQKKDWWEYSGSQALLFELVEEFG